MNDWNQYTVIARGGTFIHILNGQLMAVMVDDDPESSNNQAGQFGIEIEATTKVYGAQHLGKKVRLNACACPCDRLPSASHM